jgi:hypothetical protein
VVSPAAESPLTGRSQTRFVVAVTDLIKVADALEPGLTGWVVELPLAGGPHRKVCP